MSAYPGLWLFLLGGLLFSSIAAWFARLPVDPANLLP